MRFAIVVLATLLTASVIRAEEAPDFPFQYGVIGGSVRGSVYRSFEHADRADTPIPTTGLFGQIDLRNDTWYGRMNGQHSGGDPSGASISGAFGSHVISVKGVRLGVGIRYTGIRERYNLFSDPFVSADFRGTKHFGAGGLEIGVGRYNRTHIRASYFAGAAHLYLKADLFVNGQLINKIDEMPLATTTVSLQVIEASGRLDRSFGRHSLMLDANVRRYLLSPLGGGTNGAQRLPDRHHVLEMQATYYSPVKFGAFVRGVRTDDRRGAAFLNNTTSFGLLFRH